MTTNCVLRSLATAALIAAAGTSHAALTLYPTQASFNSATTGQGVDTYAGFSITGATASPITRTAGLYSYRAAASTSTFFGAGTTANPWLSTTLATDSITFAFFTGAPKAIGANFFGSGITGLFLAGDVTVSAVDSLGATSTQTVTAATVGSFVGFTSTGAITSLTLSAVQTASALWPTVDNLTLAMPVPEAGTYNLMLAGLGMLGFIARRRKEQRASKVQLKRR